MAEGTSNASTGRRILITEGTVEKHVRSILIKLDLPERDRQGTWSFSCGSPPLLTHSAAHRSGAAAGPAAGPLRTSNWQAGSYQAIAPAVGAAVRISVT
jgi:hypothetical protein